VGEALGREIPSLEAQIDALRPGWDVPSLTRSYVQPTVYAALLEFYDAA
jgi:hypothetical protein